MQPSNIVSINLNKLTMGENPRLPTNLNIPALAENIGEIGLLEPIHVWSPNGDDIYEVIRGHRRTMGLTMLKDNNPKRFKELFKDGVSAIVWDGITAEDAVTLKLDHGGQVTLSDPHELQMSANQMFALNFTEAQVANQLKPLIAKLKPMDATKKAEVKALEDAVSKAKADQDMPAIEKAEKELEKRIADMYRGRVQNLHDVFRCPKLVNAALFFKACGQKPVGFETEALPKLTSSQVNSLWKAHKEDLEILDENTQTPKFNKNVVGPNFSTKWAAILKAEDDKANGKPPEKPAKAMSGKDMKLEVTEGKHQSIGFCKLTQHHAGQKGVEGLDKLDTDYKAMDLIVKYNAELYEMIQTEAAKLEQELIASAKAEAKEETTEA